MDWITLAPVGALPFVLAAGWRWGRVTRPEPEVIEAAPLAVTGEQDSEIARLHLAALKKHIEQLQSEGREVPSHLVAEIERLVGTC